MWNHPPHEAALEGFWVPWALGGRFNNDLGSKEIQMKHTAWLLALTVGMAMSLVGAAASAADLSPVGYWKTIDDDGKTEKSIVQLFMKGDKLHGKILKLLHPDKPNPVCDKCDGAKKDKPIEGMEFLWGLEKDDDEWSGGTILDPKNGKEYSCYVEVIEAGKKLKVRGFMGISLLGRTQYWNRSDKPAAPAPEPTLPAPAAEPAPAPEPAE